jgi:hypothetical protein
MIDRRYNVNDTFNNTRLKQVVVKKKDICGILHSLTTTGVVGNK